VGSIYPTADHNTIIIHIATDLSQPMSNGYDPIAVESAWYDWWDAQGLFAPQTCPDGGPKDEGVFIIPAPPPNVTGSLHIGHALTTALQDALIRW
jgi:valyl-tRNA synthetase